MGNSISLIKNLKRIRKFKNAKKFKTFDSESNETNETNELHTCSYISDSSTKTESKHNYIFSSKFDESERIKRKHFVIKYIFEENFSAPVKDLLTNGCRVLDVGCGPGTWILDMASEYTRSSFVGLDIFPMFPSEIKPNNTDFILADVLNDLPFESNYFDYIHLGDMGYCFTEYEFDCIVTECRRILKPGGWIEFQEIHHFMSNPGPCSEKFCSLAKNWTDSKEIRSFPYSQNELKKNPNITNINEVVKQIPMGSWGGKLGEEFEESFYVLLFYVAKPVAKMHNCPVEEINELINNMQLEVSEYKSFYDFTRTFGQKEYSEDNEISNEITNEND
ncbi:hypothetical protein Glove_21g370 [Diversispora epigaea]|uniref:Methyltransferase domain-containing protein n=1 Tax=Diversispora epigaea TaxID=1348612 RepID=A0A397JMP2_9GLOM|nr:hypothetical protein Glove_21g370 [Diversispora epigaea]